MKSWIMILVLALAWVGFAPATTAATYTAAAAISNANPRNNTVVSVTGTLHTGSRAVQNALMVTTWRFPSRAQQCSSRTNASGTASCGYNIGTLSAGTVVRVDVQFKAANGTLLASAATSFRVGGPGDADRDGIADDVDRCPNQPETRNGVFDSDGCPDTFQDLMNFAAQDIDQYWRAVFDDANITYAPPQELIAYTPSRPVRSACGASLPNNAFFCSPDHSVYYDTNFLQQQLRTDGDFAPVTILAHEWGHLVQGQLGYTGDRYVSLQLELQADCFAGAYARRAGEEGLLEAGDLDEAAHNLFNAGDLNNTPWFTPGKHGRPDQRVGAFNLGLNQGAGACDIQ